jgi:exonuclease III
MMAVVNIILQIMIICTINCRGLNTEFKQRHLLEELANERVDIAFLQETKIQKAEVYESLKDISKGQIFFSLSQDNSAGVAILILPRCLNYVDVISSSSDPNGRWICVSIDVLNTSLNLMCLYAPTSHQLRREFLNDVSTIIQDRTPENLIMGGDFNCILDEAKDRNSRSNFNDTSHNILKHICENKSLLDTYRIENPEGQEFTWFSTDGRLASRLDRIYVERSLKGYMCKTNIKPVTFSDHNMFSITLDNADWVKRGDGFWKLNVALLRDSCYRKCVESCWRHWDERRGSYECITDWWEDAKSDLKYISRQYSIRKAREIRKRKKALQRSLCKINKKINDGEYNYYELLVKLKGRLNEIEQYQLDGAKISSRAQMNTEGEKLTRYFCNLEKARGIEKLMRSLKTNDGVSVCSNAEMIETVSEFYKSLYKSEGSEETATRDVLANITKRLPDSCRESCDQSITIDDLTKSLKGMKLERSPGCDGLPVEFYQTFWHIFGPVLEEIATSIFKQGHLPTSMAQAYVRLIYKRGDRNKIQNYRPISLLCVDYKIITRALTLKLGAVLGEVIHDDQTCSVPGRSILNNTLLIRDLIQLVEKDCIPAAIIALDNEKAFDRLEWDFLFKSLDHIGFGSRFIKWVNILYTDITSCYLVNNQLSKPVVLERGVRQGCSLSPLLFVIAMESLGATLRQRNDFQGICIRGVERPLKVSQYADDTTVFAGKNTDFRILNGVLTDFQKASGLKVNKDKSKGLFLGDWKGRTDNVMDINCSNDVIKILGIYFSREQNVLLNWEERISKLKCALLNWKRRRLTVFGRTFVLNNLILSGLWYTASVVHMPKSVESKINTLLLSFLWEDKAHLVSQSILTNEKHAGGLDLVNVSAKCASLKLKFLNKLLTSNSSWSSVSRALLQRYVDPFPVECLFMCNKLPPNHQKIPNVYKEQLEALKIFTRSMPQPNCWEDALEQRLWGNELIRDNDDVLYLPSLAKNGIQYLRDLVNPKSRGWIAMQDVARITSMRHIDAQRLFVRIKNAIPAVWFKLPKARGNIDMLQPTLVFMSEHIKYNMASRDWYRILMQSRRQTPIVVRHWNNLGCTPKNWKNAWKAIHLPCLPGNARDLAWRLFHRRLWVGHLTYMCKISSTDRCLLCNTEEETIDHLFTQCRITTGFWVYINMLLAKFGTKYVNLVAETILFKDCSTIGRIINSKEKELLITLLSVGVWAIWKHRCSEARDKTGNNHQRAIQAIFRSL